MNTLRYPKGIMPKYVHDERRFREVGDAIIRFVEARRRVPEEWIYEYNELTNTVEVFEEEEQ